MKNGYLEAPKTLRIFIDVPKESVTYGHKCGESDS